jgi:5-methylcytosine-specific restriction endonuclease McrA
MKNIFSEVGKIESKNNSKTESFRRNHIERDIYRKDAAYAKIKFPNYGFKMPNHDAVHNRGTTIAKAFAKALTPRLIPCKKEIENAFVLLGMPYEVGKNTRLLCAYCGGQATTSDHLNALVMDSKPTGFIDEIDNLVPCCGTCNSSKGKESWAGFMARRKKRIENDFDEKERKGEIESGAVEKALSEHDARVSRLQDFEDHADPIKLDYEKILKDRGQEENYRKWVDLEKSIKKLLAEAKPIYDALAPIIAEEVRKLDNERMSLNRSKEYYKNENAPVISLRSINTSMCCSKSNAPT